MFNKHAMMRGNVSLESFFKVKINIFNDLR